MGAFGALAMVWLVILAIGGFVTSVLGQALSGWSF